jgi:hypothetical protein
MNYSFPEANHLRAGLLTIADAVKTGSAGSLINAIRHHDIICNPDENREWFLFQG